MDCEEESIDEEIETPVAVSKEEVCCDLQDEKKNVKNEHPFQCVKLKVLKLFATILNNGFENNPLILHDAYYLLNIVRKCCIHINEGTKIDMDPVLFIEIGALFRDHEVPKKLCPHIFHLDLWWLDYNFDKSEQKEDIVKQWLNYVDDLYDKLNRKVYVLTL